jgi:putative tryptophan/tyrosine transport system substrate-binding protein
MRRRDFILVLSSVIAAPSAVRAQQEPVIGYLSSAAAGSYPKAFLAAFHQGLADTGYIEGQNLAIEYRWADDDYKRLPGLAKEVAERKVAAIAATGGLVTALAAKAATTTIPIVFTMGDDPVSSGIVASFARPGGNITGVSFFVLELGTKLLDLATELLPNASSSIALLANPNRPSYKPIRDAIEDAGRARRRRVIVVDATTEKDFETVFDTLKRTHVGALVITSDPLYLDQRARLVALAARNSVPAIYAWREYVAAGGLMSYGARLTDAYHDAGVYVGRILKGAKPADLPVQQPTKFELVINLKTAKALGLTLPESLLARADEVIE